MSLSAKGSINIPISAAGDDLHAPMKLHKTEYTLTAYHEKNAKTDDTRRVKVKQSLATKQALEKDQDDLMQEGAC